MWNEGPEDVELVKTGGFGDPALRAERLERLRWGLDRTVALGLAAWSFRRREL